MVLRKTSKPTFDLVQLANNFTERGRYITVFALRRFLYDRGVLMLPPARIATPTPTRKPTNLTWEEGARNSRSRRQTIQYRFKLMLHAGWGIGEFLKFNTEENWSNVKAQLAKDPGKEYYRHDFSGRKKEHERMVQPNPRGHTSRSSRNGPCSDPGHSRLHVRRWTTYPQIEGILLNLEDYHSAPYISRRRG